jgi:hypothetical protein
LIPLKEDCRLQPGISALGTAQTQRDVPYLIATVWEADLYHGWSHKREQVETTRSAEAMYPGAPSLRCAHPMRVLQFSKCRRKPQREFLRRGRLHRVLDRLEAAQLADGHLPFQLP